MNNSAKQISGMEILRFFPSNERFPRVEDRYLSRKGISEKYTHIYYFEGKILKKFEEDCVHFSFKEE